MECADSFSCIRTQVDPVKRSSTIHSSEYLIADVGVERITMDARHYHHLRQAVGVHRLLLPGHALMVALSPLRPAGWRCSMPSPPTKLRRKTTIFHPVTTQPPPTSEQYHQDQHRAVPQRGRRRFLPLLSEFFSRLWGEKYWQ